MVKQMKQSGKVLYACEECGFVYKERSWAEKCQAWCSKQNSCNMEITKHAVH